MKKTIYISIEIKNREYDSQLVLAAKAAQQGYQVYLGTHAAIYALLRKKRKAGVYLDKGTHPVWRMNWIKERVDAIFILDAELSPILNEKYARTIFPSRIYPGSEKYIDRYFVVGPVIERVAKNYSREIIHKVYSIGWPRIEVWSNLAEEIYSGEISKIRSRYGDYALFASSFGVIKDPLKTSHLPSADHVQRNEFDTREHKLAIYKNFREAISLIKEWDSNPDFPVLVVRPHTSEQISVWRRELQGLKKTLVISSGDITPWIHGSVGFISNGSTALIQASLAKRPTVFIDYLTTANVREIPLQISQFVIGDLSQARGLNFEGLALNERLDLSILNTIISNLNQSPCQSILNHIDDFEVRSEAKANSWNLILSQIHAKSLKRLLGLLRDEIIWGLGKSNLNSQHHFVPGGLDRSKIKRVLSSSLEFQGLSFKRKTINLWEIDRPR